MSDKTTGKHPVKSEHLAPERSEEDTLESSLRPKRLADFVGQQQARENLKMDAGMSTVLMEHNDIKRVDAQAGRGVQSKDGVGEADGRTVAHLRHRG